MALSDGTIGPLAFKDTNNRFVLATDVTVAVPAGYTATKHDLYYVTISGPPIDALTFTTTVGGVTKTWTRPVEPAVTDLATLRTDVDTLTVQSAATDSRVDALPGDLVTAAAKAAGRRLKAVLTGNRSVTAQGVTVGAITPMAGPSAIATSLGVTATFTDVGDIVTTSAAHGLAVGDRVAFGTITSTTGIEAWTGYYVRTVPSTTTFTISTTLGGAQRAFTTDGSTTAVYKNWPVRQHAWDLANERVNPAIQVVGTRGAKADPNFPRRDYLRPDPAIVTYAPGVLTGTSLDAATRYNGTRLDVLLRNSGVSKHIYIDGRFLTTVTLTALTNAGVGSGVVGRLPLTFTDARARDVQVLEESASAVFPGFDIEHTATLVYPNRAKGPRVLLAGDSFTEGTGVTNGSPYARWLSWLMGWPDLWRAGSGSTGYLFDGTRTSLVDRYVNDIINQAPDICLIALGLNDPRGTAAERASTVTAATTVWDAVIAGLPATELVIVGPWPNGGGVGVEASLVSLDADLRAAAEARGLRFISPISEGWTFTRADTTHPDDAGHEHIAWRLAGHLAVPMIPAA